MSARVLFTCWPFVPHVLPQLGIAVALRERGSEVAFYSGEPARAVIEAEGFEFFAFERVQQECWLRLASTERSTGKRTQSARVARQAVHDWVVETIPDQVADLGVVFERWRPDVVASELAMCGPIVVLWEATGVPVAVSSILMGAPIPGPDAPPWAGLPPPRSRSTRLRARLVNAATDVALRGMRRRVDELRAEHGLAPMGCSINAFAGRLPLYLVPSLPELDYDRRDLPASVHYVGPCTHQPPTEPDASAWLEEIPAHDPWVHVTEGTSHHQDPFVLRAAAQGLAGLPLQAILTTSRERDPDELDLVASAPNVHVARWINYDELLPRCAALVTTGGPGTVLASLQAGVPLVVVPTTWEKPDNAQRVVEAGAGIRLRPRDCTAAGLRAAVEQLLGDHRYRDNARRIAARLAEAPGPARAAELLQALGVSGKTSRTRPVRGRREDFNLIASQSTRMGEPS